MDTKQIAALRPKDSTSAEIEAAIDRGESALAELRGEATALTSIRRQVLLTGTDAALEKHDARVRAIQNDIERISATIEETLQPELSTARGRECLAEIEMLRSETKIAAERFRVFWFEKYESLAREIADGLALLKTASGACSKASNAESQAARDPDVQAVGGVPDSDMPDGVWKFLGGDGAAPTEMTCLPGVDGGSSIYWPSGRHLVTPQPPERRIFSYV